MSSSMLTAQRDSKRNASRLRSITPSPAGACASNHPLPDDLTRALSQLRAGTGS
jgi:hypothetical protein